MHYQNTVFHQLTKHIPWSVFDAAVEAHGADRRVRCLRTRDQFLAVLFGQLSGAPSLRAIVDGLESHEPRIYHSGLRMVSRSTLADANAKRPVEVYAEVFAHMVKVAQSDVRRHLRDAVRLIDATKVKLSGLSRNWTPCIKELFAAKIHVVYDPSEALPVRAVITPHNVNDMKPTHDMPIEPGATYVFDMAYYSYKWWWQLHELGCRFVTRLKTNTKIREPKKLAVSGKGPILSDRIGFLPDHIMTGNNPFTDPVREIVVRISPTKKIRLVTNDLDSPAEEITALYKLR